MKQIKSLQDLEITKDFEGVKIKASKLLKKRKKMSNIIKEYQINKISQLFRSETSPFQFTIKGGNMERSKTESSHKLPCMKTKVNNKYNQQQDFLPTVKNTKYSLNKQLSTTLKRVLRYSRPCHHSIVSYYPAAPVPQSFHITSNFETRKQTQTQIRVKRRKLQKFNQLVESSILTRDKSTTLQYQQIKRYYEQKYCKQK